MRGLTGNNRVIRSRYAQYERSFVHNQFIRKLTPAEIDEWYARLARIMNPEQPPPPRPRYRRAIV